MPRPASFIPGKVYNRLTALHRGRPTYGWYRCICGTEKEILLGHVITGKTQSCGCLHRERTAAALRLRQTTHGMYGSPEYKSWRAMLDRCRNPNSYAFDDYMGRGITVCDRWSKFENFYADMGSRPPGLTLERVDNSKGYTPGNCEWVTRKQQTNNRRSNVNITYNGRTQTVSQWENEFEVRRGFFHERLRAGWSPEKAFTTPSRKKSR